MNIIGHFSSRQVIEMTVDTQKETFLEGNNSTSVPEKSNPDLYKFKTASNPRLTGFGSTGYPYDPGSYEYIDTVQDENDVSGVYGLGACRSTQSLHSSPRTPRNRLPRKIYAEKDDDIVQRNGRLLPEGDKVDTEIEISGSETEVKRGVCERLFNMSVCKLARLV